MTQTAPKQTPEERIEALEQHVTAQTIMLKHMETQRNAALTEVAVERTRLELTKGLLNQAEESLNKAKLMLESLYTENKELREAREILSTANEDLHTRIVGLIDADGSLCDPATDSLSEDPETNITASKRRLVIPAKDVDKIISKE